MTAIRRENSTLTDGWLDYYVLPQGWTIKISLAWETFKIFRLTRISKRNIFCRKKKKNVVVYSNIQDKFISSNLTYKLKIKEFKKKMSQFISNEVGRGLLPSS